MGAIYVVAAAASFYARAFVLQKDTTVADVAGNGDQASSATTGIAMLPDRVKHRPKRLEQASSRTAWCEPRKNRISAQPGWSRDPKQAGREDGEN